MIYTKIVITNFHEIVIHVPTAWGLNLFWVSDFFNFIITLESSLLQPFFAKIINSTCEIRGLIKSDLKFEVVNFMVKVSQLPDMYPYQALYTLNTLKYFGK